MKFEKPEEVVKTFKEIFQIDQKYSGHDYLTELLKNISSHLDVTYVLLGKPLAKRPHVIKTEIALVNGAVADNFEYDLEGTPCANVISGKRVCIHSSNVADEFPEDLLLKDMGVEAYIGAPIILPDGELLGLIVLLDTKAFNNPNFYESIIELFSSRIGVEVAKERADKKILELNKEVRKKVSEKEELIKKTHESLMQQEKLAATGRLMAGIAHEIRNPLNLIKSSSIVAKDTWIELLSNNQINDNLTNDLTKVIDLIGFHSERIQQILDFMLNNKSSVEKQILSVTDIIEKSLKYSFHASDFKSLLSAIKIERDFSNEELKYEFTPDILSVFINIMENSIYALAKKLEENPNYPAHLKIKIYRENGALNISILDNGTGIDSSTLPHIFEAFYTTKQGLEGSGIGLHLCKSITESNGGKIFINSKLGDYTETILTFPLKNIEG